jgi:hypothetical protein
MDTVAGGFFIWGGKNKGRRSIFLVRTARARRLARIDIEQAINAPFSPSLRPLKVE